MGNETLTCGCCDEDFTEKDDAAYCEMCDSPICPECAKEGGECPSCGEWHCPGCLEGTEMKCSRCETSLGKHCECERDENGSIYCDGCADEIRWEMERDSELDFKCDLYRGA